MIASKIQETLARQEWIDPLAGTVQDRLGELLDTGVGEQVADVLHGTWLGHPLHPMLTDLPIGAWSTAAMLDVLEAMGNDDVAPGADAAIGFGLLTAGAAAAAGLVDWQRVGRGKNRRLGAFHALANITASALYGASLVARKRGARGVGRKLAWAGLAAVSAGGWLGGALVFDRRIGVDHGEREGLPTEWTDAMAASALAEGEMRRVQLGEVRLLLSRCEGEICAVGEVCSHLGGPLAEGTREGDCVRCPWHGSVFSLRSGDVVHGPAVLPLPRFATRERDGRVEVRLVSAGV